MVDERVPNDGRRRRSRIAVMASCVMLVLAAAGCSGGSGSGAPKYLTSPDGSCPAVDDDATAAASSASVRFEPLAADFIPTSAFRCTYALVIHQGSAPSDGFGGWQQQHVYRAAGPFDDLARALRGQPERRDGSVVCPGMMLAPVAISLTDAAGRTVTAAIPADACGRPIAAVDQAIEAMEWEIVETSD
jgi:hypothetical protein